MVCMIIQNETARATFSFFLEKKKPMLLLANYVRRTLNVFYGIFNVLPKEPKFVQFLQVFFLPGK